MKDKEQGSEKRSKKSPECFGYPISIFFIVVNEFCERFSYYGMRAVLVLYFRYFFRWDDDLATTIYHTFVALCYLTPILGAVIADSWLGKFKTIVYLSIVYCIGQVILAVSAIHDITDSNRDGTPDNMTLHIALSMVGLLLIALGTGGIKPCVAAFGGDQFEDHQDKQRSTFFSIFYLSINAGSLLSTLITPILRAQECGIHTKQQCYPLAFGVPAALMVVALIVFVVGKSMYVIDAPKGNVLLQVMKCIGFAIKNRFKNRKQSQKREHWMDWAEEKYDKLLIAQVKMVLKVLFLYIPLPMFWALYDQQGSRWTLQATTMDGNFGAFIIQPDQMQIVNPILIVIMVPIMDNLVYPLIKKCHLNFTPLRKITLGMLLAALAFVAAALLQIQIDDTMPKFPSSSQTQVRFLNLENRDLAVSVAGQEPVTVQPFQASGDYMTFNNESFTVSVAGGNHVMAHFMKGARQTILIDAAGIQDTLEDLTSKPEQGANDIKFVNGYHSELNITIKDSLVFLSPLAVSNYTNLRQGKTSISIESATGQKCHHTMQLGFGSSYTVLIQSNFNFGSGECVNLNEIEDIKQNSIHMAWQIIQYFILTCGEVIFSVTGLDFSYAQAPSNMKSVLQAGWLLTVAVGNVIVLIVAEAGTLPDQWAEYLLFASLLVAVSIIFAIMAYFYTYIDPTEIEAQFLEHEPEDKKEKNELEMKKTDLISSDTKQTKI